ncbi:Gfo/Idh/MocA family protein [Paenibacillus abyssi]|uniref:Dehydrogenase n=1 Tax=Paenibacillus abyssi TaxID=1340531 RepID=A0A917G6V5_9BACL|nr:Gfo/Idh/MocA family oxidoreductase [Paenibacillus abyssi]GGG25576.1 dehydrogenase [Paenibacillus abyssi]
MEKVRIGIIGTGGMAHVHIRQLLQCEEADIAALADVNEESCAAMITQHGLQTVTRYSDYRQMLAEMQLDAVLICTPHTLHFQQAMDALRHGCHVLIEKPMATSETEAEELIEAAKQHGKVLQVSYQRHFQPEFLFIKDAIDSGAIGRLTSVTASLYQEWRQLTEGSWRQNPALSGGGMLMDSGSHIVDVLLWTTGLTPISVNSHLLTHGSPVEIDSFTSIEFSGGVVAGLNIVGYSPCWHETYVFCGEEGGIFYDNGRITIRRLGKMDEQPVLPTAITDTDRSFIDAVLGRQAVAVPGTFAKEVVKLTERIYKSAGYEPKL